MWLKVLAMTDKPACHAPNCDAARYGRKDYCRKHYDAMQRNGNDLCRPKHRLDLLVDREPDDRRREKGDKDIANEREGAGFAPGQPYEHGSDRPPVQHNHRQHCAKLLRKVGRYLY